MFVYLDEDRKCYLEQDEEATRLEVETNAFDGYCPEYILGCRYVPEGMEWERSDGKIFVGEMKSPWKPAEQLEKAQAEYELEVMKAELADTTEALEILGVTVDG